MSSFPNLSDFPVTFARGEDSWRSETHAGFIRKVQHDPDDYRLHVRFPQGPPPPWLLNAHEADVRVEVLGETCTHRFAMSNVGFDGSGFVLDGMTTGGELPEWT